MELLRGSLELARCDRVIGSLFGLWFPEITIIRILRAFRPLRIAVRFEEVRVVIVAIGSALPALFNTAIFCILFWLVLSILGVHLFAEDYPAFVVRQDADGFSPLYMNASPSTEVECTAFDKWDDFSIGGEAVGTMVWVDDDDVDGGPGLCSGVCHEMYSVGTEYTYTKSGGDKTETKTVGSDWDQKYLCAKLLCESPSLTPDGPNKGETHPACANNYFNFNNVGKSILTLYKLGQMTSWYQELYTGVRATGSWALIFFIFAVLICGFFTLNLIIAVVVDNFNRMGEGKEYSALLTKKQAINIRSVRLQEMFPVTVGEITPTERNTPEPVVAKTGGDKNDAPPAQESGDSFLGMRECVWSIISKRVPEPAPNTKILPAPLFDNFIMLCICCNAVTMCTATRGQSPETTDLLAMFDDIFTAIYTVEAALKIFATWTTNSDYSPGEDGCYIGWDCWNMPPFKWWTTGWQSYWGDNWNKFDFIVVAASLLGYAFSSGAPTATIRLLRLCRLVKVIQKEPMMRACFNTLMYALPSMINIGVLLFIVFYIWSVWGISTFGFSKDKCDTLAESAEFQHITRDCYNGIEGKTWDSSYLRTFNFNSFGRAIIANWRLATNDEWESIYCWTYAVNAEMTVAYFASFGLFGNYLMANLFIAVMLLTLRDNITVEESQDQLIDAGVIEWVESWQKKDTRGRGYIQLEEFYETLRASPRLVGSLLAASDMRNDETVEESMRTDDFYGEIWEIVEKEDKNQGFLVENGRKRMRRSADNGYLDLQRVVEQKHLTKLFLNRKFHVWIKKTGVGSASSEEKRVYYHNAIYAIAGLVTNYMNIEPPTSEKGKGLFDRTEISLYKWTKDENPEFDGDDRQTDGPEEL